MQQIPVGEYFVWAPNWLIALVMVVAAIGVALIIHALLDKLILRLSGTRHPVIATLIHRTRCVTR